MNTDSVKFTVNSYLKSMGEGLELSEEGVCHFNYSSGLDGVIGVLEDRVQLCVILKEMPDDPELYDKCLSAALRLNKFQLETSDGCIALSFNNDALLYNAFIPTENLDEVLLSNFISNVESISLKLKQKIS